MKDATKQRCYRAEQSVRNALKTSSRDGNAPGDITFKGADAARELIDTVIVPACEPVNHEPSTSLVDELEVVPKGRTSWYRYADKRIRLIEGWGETLLVLTHECSHGLAYKVNPLYGLLPSHGGEWARLFLDAVDLVYGAVDRPDVPALLRQAFEREKAIVEPAVQREAARKQVLRLRSDVLSINRRVSGAYSAIPVTDVVFAEARGDHTGASYLTTGRGAIRIDSIDHPDHFIVDAVIGASVAVPWCNLRYVHAPMLRQR